MPTARLCCTPRVVLGFSLLELVLVITIISVLGAVLFDRLLLYREMAEKTAMEQVVGIVQSAMELRISAFLARAQDNRLEAMPLENPMGWLADKPSNYLGEYYDPNPTDLAPGSWYYDLHSHELVYLVDWGRHFIPGPDGQRWVRFRVALVYEDDAARSVHGTGQTEGKEVAGIAIRPTRPYRWL